VRHRRGRRGALTDESTEPFGQALRALMDARGLSYRGLADAIRKFDEQGITHAHLNMLANGHDKPSMRAMELIASACEVPPGYFAEWRLAAAMRELDPGVVGLEQALENLNARLAARRSGAATLRRAQAPRAQPRPTN
jgi:transcriptional regulator with XRE-family HTH domain